MDDLPHRPPIGAIGRVELRFGQAGDGGAKFRRRLGNGVDRGATLFRFELRGSLETADGISKIFHGGLR